MDRAEEILKAVAGLETRMNERFDDMDARFERLEVAVLDIGSRLLAANEVAAVKAKMSSSGLSAPPAAPVPRAAKTRG